ncbi:hypothetical protein SCLCIDRAFT_1209344 [Scleroderma citrinum Foug A]|uniref:Uncharacterized protein n=1 Tax=Scleroderma citrinum Foug A TaxID=1036808 RepID=A0A0C3E6U1_9AGAM|nr:hypothetical protein SCLCIDRAFT_1209344 [Scleroderma citrinum Foug A]
MWGLIGIHTDKFGFKNVWEIWHSSSHVAFAFPDVGHVVQSQVECEQFVEAEVSRKVFEEDQNTVERI